MRSKYRIHDQDTPYFLTATIVQRIPALNGPAKRQRIADGLAYCRREKELHL